MKHKGWFGAACAGLLMLVAMPAKADTPVVVLELFSSEGCSSCPPADRLLKEIDSAQPVAGVRIVTLEEHVDYWNYLAWHDPYSSAVFSRREEAYSNRVPGVEYATPQIVADGRIAVDPTEGGVVDAVREAIRHPKAKIAIGIRSAGAGRITVDLSTDGPPAPGRLRAVLVLTEDGLSTWVTAGENKGHQLVHSSVVRRWVDLGAFNGRDGFTAAPTVTLEPGGIPST